MRWSGTDCSERVKSSPGETEDTQLGTGDTKLRTGDTKQENKIWKHRGKFVESNILVWVKSLPICLGTTT